MKEHTSFIIALGLLVIMVIAAMLFGYLGVKGWGWIALAGLFFMASLKETDENKDA